MLILKTLSQGPQHGLGLSRHIDQITDGAFQIQPGSLFPALHRMEQKGWIKGSWGKSENRRRAKYYQLTPAGHRQLGQEQENWDQLVLTIGKVMEAS
jgi:transcriptional regulator